MHGSHGRFKAVARRLALSGLLAPLFGVVDVERAAAQVDLLGPGAGFVSVGAARISTGELDDWLVERA